MNEPREQQLKSAIQNYTSLLLHVAYTYLQNRAEAEDVVQEVFFTYYQKAPQFRNEDHEKAWLLRVTANKCKNILKSSWFHKVLLGEELPHFEDEERPDVMDAISRLPVKYREVICLHYVEGYKINEIADLLHRTPTAVGTQLQRARKRLSIELEGQI